MTIDSTYNISDSSINSSNEVKAHSVGSKKIVEAPIVTKRHIYTNSMPPNTSRLLLETNSQQSWYCVLYVNASPINYRIEVLQHENSVSNYNSFILDGAKSLYTLNSSYDLYRDIYVPPESRLYITASSLIFSAMLVATLYNGLSLELIT